MKKRFLSMLLAITMVFGMGTTVRAADPAITELTIGGVDALTTSSGTNWEYDGVDTLTLSGDVGTIAATGDLKIRLENDVTITTATYDEPIKVYGSLTIDATGHTLTLDGVAKSRIALYVSRYTIEQTGCLTITGGKVVAHSANTPVEFLGNLTVGNAATLIAYYDGSYNGVAMATYGNILNNGNIICNAKIRFNNSEKMVTVTNNGNLYYNRNNCAKSSNLTVSNNALVVTGVNAYDMATNTVSIRGSDAAIDVKGSASLSCNIIIPEGETAKLSGNSVLTVPAGTTVTNQGAIVITESASISGTIIGNQPELLVYMITFDGNVVAGGWIVPINMPSVQNIRPGNKVTEPEDPIDQTGGRDFVGWYTDPECTKKYDFDTVVTESMTLYARWGRRIEKTTVTITPEVSTYNGSKQEPTVYVELDGIALTEGTQYTLSWDKNGFVNADTYTVTITGKDNFAGTQTATFTIDPIELDETNTVVTLDQDTFVYDGTEHKPTVTVTFNGAKLTEGVDYRVFYSQPMKIVNGKIDKWFGDHITSMECVDVDGDYYAVVVGLGNFRTKDAFTLYANFVIEKATVTEPTIPGKPYTGAVQTADITDTELYTVVKNDGGTGVKQNGTYDVVLELKDPANYKWSTTDNAQVTLQFAITQGTNEWTVDPSISGWTYGEAANTPVGEAKFGDVSVEYSGTTNGGAAYNSTTAPTEAGNYKATFIVQGTEDYKGLETSVDFTIAKKAVTVTANDASKTYGESDPALTYTHTELVGSDALDITVSRASGENANTYTITASQEDGANPNYEITFKTGTFTIHKAPLTVTAEDKTATYGDAVPTYTVKYDGFVNGDDKDALGGALAFYQTYNRFDDVGEYEIMPHGLTSDNYVIAYNFGKLTVNAKPITVTIENVSSSYGEALAELKATDDGIVNGDANVYSLATTATGTSNVGKYGITGIALDSNYDVTIVNGEYEITKREITITVDAKNTVVNTTLPAYTYMVEGLVGVDTLVTEPTLTCNANIALIGEYDITASGADAGGNYSIKYVPAKLTVLTDNAVDAAAGYTEELKDYDPEAVTSEDKAELDEMLSEINTILADEMTTDNGKKALEEVKEQVEKLIKEITDAAEATDTENTEKVENVTPENVTPENKTDLEGAKADLEKALEDNGGKYTEDEKKAIEDEIKRTDDALEVIGNVEAVEDLIDKLPENITKNDEDAIKAADDAYNALSDYEKSLVDEDAKKALDDAKVALAELNKPADTDSPQTGDNSNMFLWIALLFISGGAVITLTVVDRKKRMASKR